MDIMEEKNIIYDCSRGCTTERTDNGELLCEYHHGCCKLHDFNWLGGINDPKFNNIFEVRFKNTRKGFYENTSRQLLKIGDLVVVEAVTGHDVGIITLEGPIVGRQMLRNHFDMETKEIRKIYRKARPLDLEKWQEAIARENSTMIRARQIAADLGLDMKIGDVEYQGDGNKAIFYYIADERVDFRQLIKVLAEAFHVRIEMKQIGARQEAGRIGGIGPCGRPLCCATWITNFVSVATSAARYQDISLNPQKLAGQCAKLKCCLNYEVDAYVESVKRLPSKEIHLETKNNTYFHFKTDIFKRELTYSTEKNVPANLVTITAKRAFEVIALNKRGIKPDDLCEGGEMKESVKEFGDIVGQDSVTRFDKSKKKKRKNGNRQKQQGKPSAQDGGQRKDGGQPQQGDNKANPDNRNKNGQQRRNGNQRKPKNKPVADN